ncbi:MAG: winged helix-turn-helix domain-containing protein [Candidatus Aenigmarchaeota archaeon]|nr:winged helix-turn-helix domain-containing protein [Candidatus Aenigmarchaeota archaeon]
MGNLADYFEDPVHVKIMDCLLNATTDLSKKQIAKTCGISKATLFNHWTNLEKLGLVRVTRKFGKTKLYQIDRENPIVNKLSELRAVLPEVKVQAPQKEEKIVTAPLPPKAAEVPEATVSQPPKATEILQAAAEILQTSSTKPPPSRASFLTHFRRFKLPPIKRAKKQPKKTK